LLQQGDFHFHRKRGWAIEITQPHISSKALLESLAARDQETDIHWPSASATPNAFEFGGSPNWLKGNKVPKPCFSYGPPTTHHIGTAEALAVFSPKAIVPVAD
jgi:hypothetical protein